MVESSNVIRIKWVRSGIGFPRRQKGWVRSLGLKELNQVVERPDTPQIRGLVARAGHLVEVVEGPLARASRATPEYSVQPPEVAATPPTHRAEQAGPEGPGSLAQSVEAAPAGEEGAQRVEREVGASAESSPAQGEQEIPASAKAKAAVDSAKVKKAKPAKEAKGKAAKPAKETAGKVAKASKAKKK